MVVQQLGLHLNKKTDKLGKLIKREFQRLNLIYFHWFEFVQQKLSVIIFIISMLPVGYNKTYLCLILVCFFSYSMMVKGFKCWHKAFWNGHILSMQLDGRKDILALKPDWSIINSNLKACIPLLTEHNKKDVTQPTNY